METRQTGWTIILLFLTTLIVLIALALATVSQETEGKYMLAFSPLLLIPVLLFYQLTVKVDNEAVKIRFGIGLIRKSWKLSAIESATPVKNNFFYGWGIHHSLKTSVYNIHGFSAVELKFKGRKHTVRIGTDEPEKLAAFISRKLSK